MSNPKNRKIIAVGDYPFWERNLDQIIWDFLNVLHRALGQWEGKSRSVMEIEERSPHHHLPG